MYLIDPRGNVVCNVNLNVFLTNLNYIFTIELRDRVCVYHFCLGALLYQYKMLLKRPTYKCLQVGQK